MAADSKYQGVYPQLVTKIIASYVSHHNVSPEQIPDLISSVHRTIDNLGKPVEPQAALIPAVPVRRSVSSIRRLEWKIWQEGPQQSSTVCWPAGSKVKLR